MQHCKETKERRNEARGRNTERKKNDVRKSEIPLQ
jgi:hypothetical protein